MSEVPWKKMPLVDITPASLRIPLPPRDMRDRREVAKIVNAPLPPRHALTAASRKVDPAKPGDYRRNHTAAWQQEVFAFEDQVGELSYASALFANSASKVKLELARRDEKGDWILLSDLDSLNENDKLAQQAIRELTWDLPMAELIRDASAQMFLVGECRLVGMPSRNKRNEGLLDFDWHIYSVDDVVDKEGYYLICGEEYSYDSVLVIKIWRPSPRKYKDPTSPVRAVLPVLRELVGLTMHISACIDSRLAGAGIVWMPQSATVLGLGGAPENADEDDPFLEAVIEAGVTAIKDRDSAAAIIPIFATLPDDVGFQPIHMSFSTPFDASTKELRDEAIRRLALGLDMPPEVLLGTGGSSHWSAWAIQEDYVKLHVLPAVNLIAQAIVRDYLRPVLEEMGLPLPLAYDYNLIPLADHMFSRPNRFDEAMELYRMDAINLAALLEVAGFDLKDAPKREQDVDHAVLLALRAAAINPSLIENPGLMSMISQFRAALAGKDLSTATVEELPPMLQQALGYGPESDEKRKPSNEKTAIPATDPTKNPESSKDRQPNEPGPAVSRERDRGRDIPSGT